MGRASCSRQRAKEPVFARGFGKVLQSYIVLDLGWRDLEYDLWEFPKMGDLNIVP